MENSPIFTRREIEIIKMKPSLALSKWQPRQNSTSMSPWPSVLGAGKEFKRELEECLMLLFRFPVLL
jgi:hypothetical protein